MDSNALDATALTSIQITNPHPAGFSLSGVTMHANPIIWLMVGIMAQSAISSLIHMSEGLLWLNLLWAR